MGFDIGGWQIQGANIERGAGRDYAPLTYCRENTRRIILQALFVRLYSFFLRVEQLSGESNAAMERVAQLLVEKEKALADLKTIRKTNKTMEK